VEQLKLFDLPSPYRVHRPPRLPLSPPELAAWKQRISQYQTEMRPQALPRQGLLFGPEATDGHEPDEIDPFALTPHSSLFWRQPPEAHLWEAHQKGCLYFILDLHWPLLLYVGETQLSASQRWRGTHHCKDYILRYLELHRQYHQPQQIVCTFWPHVPAQKRRLQQWEKQLILKWRSPFNKECWQWWGQPFGLLA
jgi:hypothetical protein